MAFPVTHSIQRQVFEFNVPKQEGTFEAMNRLKASFQQEILPLMGEVLDELNVPGMTIRLDRIEVDLGDIRVDALEFDFRNAVKRELRKELIDKLRAPGAESLRPEVILEDEQVKGDLLSHILVHGSLPWWTQSATKSVKQQIKELLEGPNGQLRSSLPRLLKNIQVRRRLAISLDSSTLDTLLKHLNNDFSVGVSDLERLTMYLTDSGRAMQKSRGSMSQITRELALACWELAQPAVIFSTFLEALQAQVPKRRLRFETEAADFLPASLKTAAVQALKEQAAKRMQRNNAPENKTDKKRGSKADGNLMQAPAEMETIYLDNAGLVLVHLYLPILFEEFDLVADGTFVDEDAVSKALSLLRYLAWADEEREEFQQGLDKVLCGQQPKDAFSVSLPLTETEMAECDRMLEAINANWKPMNGSSAQGLRDTFLKREGRLDFNGQAWELKIDRKGWDVLIEQLPWAIGIVKTPWMEFPLFVEW